MLRLQYGFVFNAFGSWFVVSDALSVVVYSWLIYQSHFLLGRSLILFCEVLRPTIVLLLYQYKAGKIAGFTETREKIQLGPCSGTYSHGIQTLDWPTTSLVVNYQAVL